MKRSIFPTEVKRSERGASMLEYAMIVALLSVVVIAGVTSIGNETRITFDKVTEEMGKAGVTEDNGL